MNRLHRATIGEELDGERLDSCLASLGIYRSRSAAVKALEAGDVLVNGAPETSKKRILNDGDRIEATVVEEEQEVHTLEPERIPLDVRYEDDYLLVISKQRGLVCHPSPGHESHTLAHALVAHCGADHLGMMQGEDRPGIVHRLDMDTTGLMLAAKDDQTQDMLQNAIRLRSIDRRYVTLVQGYIAPDSGMVDAPIARHHHERLRMTVSTEAGARSSVTTFKVLERFEAGRHDEGYTLLECKLFTGRTHQIRVHMAYIGHHVVGDPQYGRGDEDVNLGLDRQFLHSWTLGFDHPRTGEHLSFTDALTWELDDALAELQKRSMGRTQRGEEVLSALADARTLQDMGW